MSKLKTAIKILCVIVTFLFLGFVNWFISDSIDILNGVYNLGIKTVYIMAIGSASLGISFYIIDLVINKLFK